ncbi:MAG: hypothetical protein AB1757_09975 [Acidobacteriota bacterium]
MFSLMIETITTLLLIFSLTFTSFGQQATPQPQPAKPAKVVQPKVAPVTTTQPAAVTIAPVQTPQPTVAATPAPALTATVNARPAIAPIAVTVQPAQPSPQSQPTPKPTVATTQAPAAKEPDYVSEKGFKGKVLEVKYRELWSLLRALSPLGSGFKGATISTSEEFKTITVRDFPENIAAIEEALKRLDTPQAPRPDINFTIQVLIASNTTLQGDGISAFPSDLKGVLDQLMSTLKYTNYALMFSAIHTTKEGGSGISNNGVVEPKLFNVAVPQGNQIFSDYSISQITLDSSTTAGATVQIGMFQFNLRIPLVIGGSDAKVQYQNVGFRSPVSLREGEKVVVGTTTMGDKGLIVVLSAKVKK